MQIKTFMLATAIFSAAGPAPSPALAQAPACTAAAGATTGFFCAPRVQGRPVKACTTPATNAAAGAACRQATAENFCRLIGYASAVTVGEAAGALAEVTCTARPTAVPATTAATTAPAVAAPAAAPQVLQDYVYATSFDGGAIRPSLQISAFGADMTGMFTSTNPRADFDVIYSGGGGVNTQGRMVGRFVGNEFRGTWYENENELGLSYVQRTCEATRDGTHVWGQFALRFTPDRRRFTGTITGCETNPEEASFPNNWTGTLTGRVDPTPPTKAKATASRGAKPAAGNSAGSRPPEIVDEVADEAAQAASQRARDETRRGVNRAIDALIGRPF